MLMPAPVSVGGVADGGGAPLARPGGHELGHRRESGGAQDRPFGVDVVLRDLPAGEDNLADHERVLAQLLDQTLPCHSSGVRTFGQGIHVEI